MISPSHIGYLLLYEDHGVKAAIYAGQAMKLEAIIQQQLTHSV